MKKPKLRIIRGLPGSGKTTFAKTFGCFHVEQDMRLIQGDEYTWTKERIPDAVRFCRLAAKLAMLEGLDVVVSNTFTRLLEMEWYLDFARYRGYDVTVYKMTGVHDSVHNVPEAAMKIMKGRWEGFPGEIEISE